MKKTFSIKQAIKDGWHKIFSNFLFVIGAIILVFLISFILSVVSYNISEGAPLVSTLLQFVSFIVDSIVSIGFYKIFLKLFKGEEADFSDFYEHWKLFLSFLIANIIYGFLVFVGLLLFIVPGVYVILTLIFTKIVVVDSERGAVESLKRSAAITKGIKWKLLGFLITLLGINILGVILLGIGLFITVPLSLFALISVYMQLEAQTPVVSSEQAPVKA